MNRVQTQALVDLWDDIDVACRGTDLDPDEINITVNEDGDDIETVTNEPDWVEVVPWVQGSGPVLLLDPRGKMWREDVGFGGRTVLKPCTVCVHERASGTLSLKTLDITDNNGDN